jgi:hypothetical protein
MKELRALGVGLLIIGLAVIFGLFGLGLGGYKHRDEKKTSVVVVETTYKVKVCCVNCEESFKLSIPKGTNVVDVPCPNCGCKTLVSVPSVF